MREITCLTTVEDWIQSCHDFVPLEVNQDFVNRPSLKLLIETFPKLRGQRVEAVLGLRIGAIDRAHEIVQSGSTSMDRYLHGVVHRVEGDFWNAKYWFRQVEDCDLLTRIGVDAMSMLKELTVFEPAKSLKIFDDQSRFVPQNLVDAQAALLVNSSCKDRLLIQQVAQAEWDAIWKIVSKHDVSW